MIVLEVAIGLVLIYFLYSLLSSIIAEMISSWIGMRARMLRQGMDNFLNDKITGSTRDFKKWLQDIFLIEPKNFKFTTAGKFYEEPTIKYLAKPGEHAWYSLRNRKPAYVSAENFVITVLNMLSNKGRGISEWDKIKFAIETNALHLDPETLKMFQDMVKRSDDSYKNFVNLIQNHFADTMERVNGWYKRKIGLIIFYIGIVMCIILNVDTIQIVKTLSNDKEKRLKMVELADKAVLQKSEIDKLMSIKDSINELKYKQEAHGIVKESVLEANDILALGWDFKIENKKERICVSKDSSCTHCIMSNDTTKIQNLISEIKNLNKKSEYLQFIIDKKLPASPVLFKSDTTIKQLYESILPKIDTFTNDQVLLDSLNKKLSKLQAKDLALFLENQKSILDTVQIKHDSLVYLSGVDLMTFDSIAINGHKSYIYGQGFPSLGKKVAIVSKALTPWKPKLWGILITALALTLGAQFWFDLLKKLIALRSAGVKPEENEEKKKQLEKLKLSGDTITSKDPVEIAISQNRGYWESLPGFLGYNVKKNDKEERYIEISLDEKVRKILPEDNKVSVILPETMSSVEIDIKFKLFGKAKFENSSFKYKGAIKQSATNAVGTPAGIVKNNRTGNLAILTCGHVARIDKSTFISNEKSKVYFFNGNDWKSEIGETSNIVISSFCDGGVIDITNHQHGLDLKFIKEFRATDTLLKTEKYKLHSLRGVKRLNLYEKSFYTTISDNGGQFDMRMLELLVFKSKSKEDFTIGGDSGSLVTDGKDCPIGIHIGGYQSSTTKFCYVVKMKDLMEILQISTIQNIQS